MLEHIPNSPGVPDAGYVLKMTNLMDVDLGQVEGGLSHVEGQPSAVALTLRGGPSWEFPKHWIGQCLNGVGAGDITEHNVQLEPFPGGAESIALTLRDTEEDGTSFYCLSIASDALRYFWERTTGVVDLGDESLSAEVEAAVAKFQQLYAQGRNA